VNVKIYIYYSSIATALRAAMDCWLKRYLSVYWLESHLFLKGKKKKIISLKRSK
jgi:hypothetical protein